MYVQPENSELTNHKRKVLITPQKFGNARRPRSNMKSYRGRSPIADENDNLSQDIGQESNIINLDNSSGHVETMMKTVLKMDPVFLKKRRHPFRGSEKNPFRTRLQSVNSAIRAPSCNNDSGTPRGSEDEDSHENIKLKPACLKSDEVSTKESQKITEEPIGVNIIKWLDYSHKYGVAYLLSNNSIGVLYNDETKLIITPGNNGISCESPAVHGESGFLSRFGSQTSHFVQKIYYFSTCIN